MDEQLPWFRTMPADQRSWVMLVAQAGIASLVEWCRNPGRPPRLTGEVFGAAPRELVRAVAAQADRGPGQGHRGGARRPRHLRWPSPATPTMLRLAVLQFSREVAFATAHVYASFAEDRGAWDARLEALAGRRAGPRRAVRGAARPRRRPRLVGDHARSPCWWAPRRRDRDPHAAVAPGGPRRCAARCSSACTPTQLVVVLGGREDLAAVVDAGRRGVRARARSSSGRSSTGLGRARRVRRRRAGRAARGPRPGRRPRGRWPPTPCCPSAPSTATRWPGRRCEDGSPLPLQAAGGEVLETVRRGAGQRRQPGGQRAGALRAPEHRPLPAQAGRGADRASGPPTPAAAGRCRWPWPSPASDRERSLWH